MLLLFTATLESHFRSSVPHNFQLIPEHVSWWKTRCCCWEPDSRNGKQSAKILSNKYFQSNSRKQNLIHNSERITRRRCRYFTFLYQIWRNCRVHRIWRGWKSSNVDPSKRPTIGSVGIISFSNKGHVRLAGLQYSPDSWPSSLYNGLVFFSIHQAL